MKYVQATLAASLAFKIADVFGMRIEEIFQKGD